MKSIYVVGPSRVACDSISVDEIKTELKKLGYLVKTSIGIGSLVLESNLSDRYQQTISRNRIKIMLNCDHVITAQNWSNDDQSLKEVKIARLLDIPVSHFSIISSLAKCTH